MLENHVFKHFQAYLESATFIRYGIIHSWCTEFYTIYYRPTTISNSYRTIILSYYNFLPDRIVEQCLYNVRSWRLSYNRTILKITAYSTSIVYNTGAEYQYTSTVNNTRPSDIRLTGPNIFPLTLNYIHRKRFLTNGRVPPDPKLYLLCAQLSGFFI